jgi:hypothetical protein
VLAPYRSPSAMNPALTTLATSDYAAAVRHRSWEWLLELRRRLNVDVQLVDSRRVPLLPEPSEAMRATLKRPELATAVKRSIQSKATEAVSLWPLQVSCVPIGGDRGERGAQGALIIVRELTRTGESAEACQAELDTMGGWLKGAIEAHLASEPSRVEAEEQRIASLHRVLERAAAAGSEHALLRVCADALAIWYDLEVRAYSEQLDGRFVLEVAPAGAAPGDASAVLAGDSVPPDVELTRLPIELVDKLGFPATHDLMAARRGPWWLCISGQIEQGDEPRLVLCVEALWQSLQLVAAASEARLERAIASQLLSATADIENGAGAALRDLRTAVEATRTGLAIVASQGGRTMSVGDDDVVSPPRSRPGPERIAVSRTIADRATLTLAVGRATGQAFNRRDLQKVESAARLFESWATGLVRGTELVERRAVIRPFAEVIEHAGAQAVKRGTSVSVLVIRIGEETFRPGLTHRWAARIRTHLRAAEVVGALNEQEIGVLLYDIDSEQSRSVAGRLHHVLESDRGDDQLQAPLIGVAHYEAGSAWERSAVTAAREDALGRPGA